MEEKLNNDRYNITEFTHTRKDDSLLKITTTTCKPTSIPFAIKFIEFEEPRLDEIPIIKRGSLRPFDPSKPFRFNITDHEIGTKSEQESHDDIIETDEQEEKDETIVYLFGTTGGTELHSVTVFVEGYRPFLRLSLPYNIKHVEVYVQLQLELRNKRDLNQHIDWDTTRFVNP